MVYTKILVIRGITLSKNDVLRIYDPNLHPNDEADTIFAIMENCVWDRKPFLGQFNLYTWPCCSKLNGEKFILGLEVGKYDIDHMFDTCVKHVTVDVSTDNELKSLLADNHGLSDPQNYLLLNDCTSCS